MKHKNILFHKLFIVFREARRKFISFYVGCHHVFFVASFDEGIGSRAMNFFCVHDDEPREREQGGKLRICA